MEVGMFDRQFATMVVDELEKLCQQFLETVPYELACKVQEQHPQLSHSNIMDAINQFVQPDGDGSREKATIWFEFSNADVISAFEQEFNEEGEE
jgi:hypothetical protein